MRILIQIARFAKKGTARRWRAVTRWKASSASRRTAPASLEDQAAVVARSPDRVTRHDRRSPDPCTGKESFGRQSWQGQETVPQPGLSAHKYSITCYHVRSLPAAYMTKPRPVFVEMREIVMERPRSRFAFLAILIASV